MDELSFETEFRPAHGQSVPVAQDVLRVTASNSGPLTFHGTNSYIVGRETVVLIDPGPIDEAHKQTLLSAVGRRPISHIFVTHTHLDHSPLSREIAAATGAQIVGAGSHQSARGLYIGEINPLDAANDYDHDPDRQLHHNELVELDGFGLRAIETAGHAANHLAFALEGTGIVFTGDHVMAWATTIVAPPDGSMSDYMASLNTLLQRDDGLYFPGHGGRVRDPGKFVRGLKAHRKMRERSIIARLEAGDRTVREIVAQIYRDTDKRLHGAASLSTLAHLEDLIARQVVQTDGAPRIDGIFAIR